MFTPQNIRVISSSFDDEAGRQALATYAQCTQHCKRINFERLWREPTSWRAHTNSISFYILVHFYIIYFSRFFIMRRKHANFYEFFFFVCLLPMCTCIQLWRIVQEPNDGCYCYRFNLLFFFGFVAIRILFTDTIVKLHSGKSFFVCLFFFKWQIANAIRTHIYANAVLNIS